ncbi:hypothetical protein [Miniimonas sp. S16]|uniref:hypothetical protein n=1 Tax=Miniimonas sp. S16 TaxID=2171623 RepID=UPI000D5270D5|nr:hypothetical protein [Miniimonas sp. S16]
MAQIEAGRPRRTGRARERVAMSVDEASRSGELRGPLAPTVTVRPFWRTPRFALGLALVAAAVALGSWAVERASSGEQAWVATTDLAPGDRLTADVVTAVRLSWDGASGTYLAGDALPQDGVVTSFVGAGELVPSSAVGTAADVTGRPVPVPVPAGAQVRPGAVVDLWSVPDGDDGEATVLAEGVTVLGVEEDSGLFRSASGEVARVLVPADVVGAVLQAQADGATVTLVEHPGG